MNKNPPIFVILNHGLLILCQILLKSQHSCECGLLDFETNKVLTNFRKMMFWWIDLSPELCGTVTDFDTSY